MEDEIFGKLTKSQFKKFLAEFTERFGVPEHKERIKISYWDPSVDKNFDAQLRITNGVPEVMIKNGSWENQVVASRAEESFEITPTVENCMDVISAFDLMYKTSFAPNAHQYEHYIWDLNGYEIKLAKQFNQANAYYLFEVELDGATESLEEIGKSLGLIPYVLVTDLAFWDEWNKVVNTEFGELSKKEQEEMISGYL